MGEEEQEDGEVDEDGEPKKPKKKTVEIVIP